MSRHPSILDRTRTGLLVIDIQEKICAAMAHPDRVVENSVRLVKGFTILNLPIFVTEQYPKGIGATVPKLKKVLKEIKIIEKTSFSCCGIQGFIGSIRSEKIDQLVLCGIESHVCVLQTAMDLKHEGFMVSVVADALSSRKDSDHDIAMLSMRSHGINVTTTEMVLFELLKTVEDKAFKDVHKLIK